MRGHLSTDVQAGLELGTLCSREQCLNSSATAPQIFANSLSTTFYDLKVTFGYIGERPDNFMSKYTQEVYEYFENKHCIFWSKHDCFTAFLDIMNTLREEILAGRKFGGFGGFCPKPPN